MHSLSHSPRRNRSQHTFMAFFFMAFFFIDFFIAFFIAFFMALFIAFFIDFFMAFFMDFAILTDKQTDVQCCCGTGDSNENLSTLRSKGSRECVSWSPSVASPVMLNDNELLRAC